MHSARIAGKLKERLVEFSGKVSVGLPKVARRFVRETLFGICARQSVRLSEICRSLDEEIPEIKTENRLSSQLYREGLGASVRSQVLQAGASRVGKETLLILDLSDLSKKYAKKMEYLAPVRDGSAKEIAPGYWTLQVVGASVSQKEIVPLWGHLYSCASPRFESENEEILGAIREVSGACGGLGIWVMDRGGDREHLFRPLLEEDRRFLIRLVGDRHLLFGGRPQEALSLAQGCPLPYAETVVREMGGKPKAVRVEFGFREVRLPFCPGKPLWMVVVKGFGEAPLMMLTNVPMRKKRKVLWWAVEAYLTRWTVEETIRFVKQSYQVEDIRVLKYRRLQNMYCLLLAVTYFASVYLGLSTRLAVLAHHAIKAAKRFFGVPDFRYYAIADGIRAILARHGGGITPRCGRPPNPLQPCLFQEA